MLFLYKFITFILTPVYLLILLLRIVRNKETLISALNKCGISNSKRSQTKLIWIHAASIGESMISVNLVEAITKRSPELQFLVTSCTKSSGEMLRQRLPINATYQAAPMDNIIAVSLFLIHWRPNLGIFVESEIWPCLITQTTNYCKLILVNGRISDKSFNHWKKIPTLSGKVMSHFSEILTQSEDNFDKFSALNAKNVKNLGNLKFTNKQLPFNKETSVHLRKIFENKKVILAVSTYNEDEEVLISTIKKLKNNNVYFILIPRHKDHLSQLKNQLRQIRCKFSIHSRCGTPDPKNNLYIVDAFGLVGLFCSIADITFVGGSFGPQGGHSPIEPAYFNNMIIFGPRMSNWNEIATEMVQKKYATQVHDADQLTNAIINSINITDKELAEYKINLDKFIQSKKNIIDDYISIIERYINN
ncbi:MAG: 3-deoxy-D-manno-octulosonic acid transferase [Rickettsiaceae bacterium]